MDAAALMDIALKADPNFIGKVYRLDQSGKSPLEMAQHFDHKNTKNVVGFLYAIRALKGELPVSSLNFTSRKQLIFVVERYLTMAKEPKIKAHLESLLLEAQKINRSGPEMATPSDSTGPIEPSTSSAPDIQRSPGVYVYSYPQYLSMESVSPDGRAFYKIGASGKVANRVDRQRRQTEVPEDLVLVRVFYDEDPFGLERKFHSILRAANMHQKTTQGGAEWFSCNLATIDAIAAALNVKVG